MKLSNKNKIIILVLIVAAVFEITFLRVVSLNKKANDSLYKKNAVQINSENISSFSKSQFNSNNLASKKILLFVDFADFACLPCSEGVVAICKSLSKELKVNERENVLILIRKRKGTEAYYSWLVEDWRKENDIVFPIKIVKDSFFEQAGINKTSIAIIDKNQKVIEYKEFPMQNKEIEKIIKGFL